MWRISIGAVVLATVVSSSGCGQDDARDRSAARPEAPAATASAATPTTKVPLAVADLDVGVRDDLVQVFADADVTGTFALLDVSERRLTVVNRERAMNPAVPASTFKIPHSLIALETAAVQDVDEIVPYGGRPQPFPQWERDMSLRDALPASNAAIYQELARRIGPEQERAWLKRLDYGNQEIGSAHDRFWLDGPLKISPVEQTLFLHRFAERTLPVTGAHMNAVAELLRMPTDGPATLYGKTGLIFQTDPQLGWWVGWVERPDGRLYTFALTIDIDQSAESGRRVPLGEDLLRRLGALP